MTTFLVPKSSENFNCKCCDYNTSRKSQYERHLSTSKHINTTVRLQKPTILVQNVPKIYTCCNCDKEYKHHYARIRRLPEDIIAVSKNFDRKELDEVRKMLDYIDVRQTYSLIMYPRTLILKQG